jgi:hypothetical protein
MASAIGPLGAPSARGPRSKDVPEELMVDVAPAVVSDRCPESIDGMKRLTPSLNVVA